jgi:acyl carrier protein
MAAVYDTMVDLMVDRFEVDRAEIRPDISFEDLEMDSLFLVELLVVLQSELGVKLGDDVASPRDTLQRAAELIEEQVVSARAS